MNEMLFRQLERMLKEARYGHGCYSLKDLEKKVLSLNDQELFEATSIMYNNTSDGIFAEFNYPLITYTFVEKGDVNSYIFNNLKNRIINWEYFVNAKPCIDENRTYLQALLARDSELTKEEVEKVISIVTLSRGTRRFEDKKEKVISKYGTAVNNTVLIKGFSSVYSEELYQVCINETEQAFKNEVGLCLTETNQNMIDDLKFLVLKHHSFADKIVSLTNQLFASPCIYQAFIDDIDLSIQVRLEKCGLKYDFLDDILNERFEIYGELDMDNEFESGIVKDIIAIEKILDVRPYPFISASF